MPTASDNPRPAVPPLVPLSTAFLALRERSRLLLRERAQELHELEGRLQDQLSQLTAELARSRAEHSAELERSLLGKDAELVQSRTASDSELERARGLLRERSQQLHDLEVRMQEQLTQLTQLTAELERLRVAHAAELERYQIERDAELKRSHAEHTKELERSRAENAQELERIRAEYVSRLENSRSDLQSELEQRETAREAELHQARTQHREHGQQLHELETRLQEQQTKFAQVTAELERLRVEHAAELNRFQHEHAAALEKYRAEHKAELDRRLTEQESEREQARHQLRERSQQLHDVEVRLQDQLTQFAQLTAELERSRFDYDTKLKRSQSEHDAEIERTRREHELQMQKLRAEHQEAAQQTRTEHQQALKEARAEHQEELEQARAEHQDAMQQARTEHKRELQRVQDELNRAPAEKGGEPSQPVAALAELDESKERIVTLEREVRSLQKLRRDSERALHEAQVMLAEMDADCRALNERLAAGTAAGGSAPSADESEELDRLRRRLEMATQEIRELKHQNTELSSRATQPAARAASAPVDNDPQSFDWETQKKRLLQQLESDYDARQPEQAPTRLQIEEVIRKTDQIIAEKDRQIAELHRQLAERPAVTGEADGDPAAAHQQHLDADEVIATERTRLSQLQDEWREKLRKSEIEISIERAKLARERLQLEERLRTLQFQAGKPEEEGAKPADVTKDAKARSTPRGRWLNRLGLGDDSSPG